jgi:hypothetical protein
MKPDSPSPSSCLYACSVEPIEGLIGDETSPFKSESFLIVVCLKHHEHASLVHLERGCWSVGELLKV